MNNSNPLNNQNYINKDFQTIYPELLELVKKLTYKWDPTISNESDPGVVLIKLNALIADKNNYNIDKNILECFPDTVTQQGNAYKLYNQLGYNMHWYRGATGQIAMQWQSEPLQLDGVSLHAPIPLFTMVCDEEKTIVYTTLKEVNLDTNAKNTQYVDAIQGVIRDYTIGSNNLIKITSIDDKNRLYFPITNVAENGIFILNADLKDSDDKYIFNSLGNWTKVDNLHIEPLNSKVYQFGIDQTTNTPYIEFPTDIANLIGEGLLIKYIQTNGAEGNIPSHKIKSFYTDVNINLNGNINDISQDVKISNPSSITNGTDQESIDNAYVNYKKTVGTFNTLVTLRDYLNYIMGEELISNGVVTDRTNDIQSSYKIVNTLDNTTTIKTIFMKNENVPEMSAFDLKTYFLTYSAFPMFTSDINIQEQINNYKKAYDKSFEFNTSKGNLNTSEEVKNAIKDSKRIEHDFISKLPNRPLIYKNKFNLDITIIPNTLVTETQANEIEKNVYKALYEKLQARNISFGSELSYETIYDICTNADNRIKAIALDNITYNTYAITYLDHDYIENMPIIKDINGTIIDPVEGLNEILISQSVIDPEGDNYEETFNDNLALDIAAKNILAGNTSLFDKNSEFKYSLNQRESSIFNNVHSISTSTELEFPDLISSSSESKGFVYNKLLDNESLFLYAPNLINETEYSVGIKYVYYDKNNGSHKKALPAGTNIVLNDGQVLFLFWKSEDSIDAPYLYAKYTKGTILSTTSKLIATTNEQLISALETGGYEGEGQILGVLNDIIYDIDDTILSSNKVITIKRLNKVELNDEHNYCYWITNNIEDNKYKIEFEHKTSPTTEVEISYSNGEIVVSNEYIQAQTDHKLEYDLFILTPIIDQVITYSYDPDTKEHIGTTTDVTKYSVECVAKNCTVKSMLSISQHSIWSSIKGDFNTVNKQILGYEYEDLDSDPTGTYKKVVPSGVYKSVSEITAMGGGNVLSNGVTLNKLKTNDEQIYDLFDYQLKTNEYFIYTDDTKQELHILGAGTGIQLQKDVHKKVAEGAPFDSDKIYYIKDGDKYIISTDEEFIDGVTYYEKDLSNIIHHVQTMDYDKIITDGSKAFTDDMWYDFSISKGELLNVTENQIIILGEGTEVKVMLDPATSEGAYYWTDYANLKFTHDGVYIKGLGENAKYSKADNVLHNYTIQYRGKDDDSWSSVPEGINTTTSWDGYTILNINSGSEEPQLLKQMVSITLSDNSESKLYHYQKFEILYESDASATLTKVSIPDTEMDYSPYIQTSSTIELAGGQNIDTSATINGKTTYLNLLKYKLNSLNTDDDSKGYTVVEKGDQFIVNVTKNISENGTFFNIDNLNIDNKKHILPITFNADTKCAKFVLSLGDGVPLRPLGITDYDLVVDDEIKAGTYYFNLDMDGYNELEINVALKEDLDDSEVSFTLEPLFTYEYMKNKEDIDYKGFNIPEGLLLEKIESLNVDNTFNYTYQALDNGIKNPLSPKSFFDSQHICNAFTIPQINKITIKTMNKRS